MTTRFYFAGVTGSAVAPALDTDWGVTASAVSRKLKSTPGLVAGALGSVQLAETSGTLVDRLLGQFVSDGGVLPVGPIAGTFSLVMPMSESSSGADMFQQVRIHVFDAAGTTKRGTIYDGQSATTPSATVSAINGELTTGPQNTRIFVNVALIPGTTAQSGDRLVVEHGYRACNATATSVNGSAQYRDDNLTDHALTAGVATNNLPWIEFDFTAPPGTPTGLTIDPDITTADLDWTASTGSPTGYEIRLNGGSATDVGNVLTHTYTGLTAATAYNSPGAEVRAYNAGGYSSWASISFTTDSAGPGTPTNLDISTTDVTGHLSWDAATGSPTGYDVRVDGGSPIDVGNVLDYVFLGLDPDTTYTFEVRAYNGSGDSAWASIEGTTAEAGEANYSAEITIGEHEWTIVSGDCEDDDVRVLDNLSIGWEIDEAAPWPAQPGAVTCKIGLFTEDVANLADVVIGTPFSVVLTDSGANVFATFHGRVARQAAVPIKRGTGVAMLYTLTGVDYTVDLAELPITTTEEWPAESADDRFERIVDAIEAAGVLVDPPADTGDAAFEAYPAGSTSAQTLLETHLAQVAIDNGDGPQRYIVAPVVAAGVLERFSCALLDRVVDSALLPGTLDVVDGLLSLVFPSLTADGVIDACAVELEAVWNRLKYRAVNQVTVAGETVTAIASRPGPPVRLNMQTTLTDADAAQRMAQMYLPDVDESDGWVADTFRLLGHRRPSSLVPAWFPDHREDPVSTFVYIMPFAIVGIPAAINLSGDSEVYAGQLVKVDLTIHKQKIYVDFSLRRQLPTNAGAEAASWEWVLATFPTITWDDVDPNLSWYDARLARRS